MVRAPVVDNTGVKRGAWSMEEDHKLRAYVEKHGPSKWRQVPRLAGLTRCGKSSRLRWLNYLRPGLKRGNYTVEENDLICQLHEKYGNRWSVIATSLPGRTDNEIKNHWNAHLKKQVKPKPASSQPKQKQLGPNVTSQLLQPGHNAISETEAFSDYSSSQLGILESSPLSQETSSSCDDNFGVLNWELEDHNGYGDFWTEPFIWDNRYVGQVLDSSLQLSASAEYGMFSPHHETTYDDYIDLFCSLL